MKKIALFSTVLALTASLSCAADSTAKITIGYPTLADDEAFVLVSTGARGDMSHYVSSLTFTDDNSGLEVSMPIQKGLQLVKVKAGTFEPEAFGIRSKTENQATKSLPQKYTRQGIKIEAGTVTYIGNWNVRYGQRVKWHNDSYMVENTDYSVRFAPEDVEKFVQANKWLTSYPLHVSHLNGKRLESRWSFEGGNRVVAMVQ